MHTSTRRTRRHRRALVLALALAAVAAPAAQAEHEFIPGVTDSPSRLGLNGNEDFVPGVTDVPSRLGLHANDDVPPGADNHFGVAGQRYVGLASSYANGRGTQPSPAPARMVYADRFDWRDAGIGASTAALAMLLAGASALAVRKRARLEESA